MHAARLLHHQRETPLIKLQPRTDHPCDNAEAVAHVRKIELRSVAARHQEIRRTPFKSEANLLRAVLHVFRREAHAGECSTRQHSFDCALKSAANIGGLGLQK